MKKRVYFLLEIKRILKTALQTFAGAIVLAVIVGTVAFCAQRLLYGNALMDKIRIGIVVESEDAAGQEKNPGGVLGMALNFLESMDSVETTCEFVYLDRETALEQLDSHGLSAVMLVPSKLVENIIDGTNTPIQVLFAREDSLTAAMLQALTDAGARTLGSAQAGIYAVYDLYAGLELGEYLQDAYDALNQTYLKFALARGRAFHYETVSVTGDLTSSDFYKVNGAVFFVLLSGMGLAQTLRRESSGMRQKLRAAGMSSFWYTAIRFAALWIFYAVFVFALLMLLFYPQIPLYLLVAAGVGVSAASASVFMAVYQGTSSAGNGMLVTFGLVMAGMLLSGGLIPAGFMPQTLMTVGRYLPTGFMLNFLYSAVSGRFSVKDGAGILIYTVAFFTVAWAGCASLHRNSRLGRCTVQAMRGSDVEQRGGLETQVFDVEQRGGLETQVLDAERNGRGNGQIFWRIWLQCSFKRVVMNRAFMGILAAFAGIMMILGMVLGESNASVRVCVYAQNPEDDFTKEILRRLEEDPGILDFYRGDSVEALKADVSSGKAQCGYILPEDLKTKMDRGENKNLITTWVSPASTASRLVDEVVFSYMFEVYAPWVYSDFLESAASDGILPWESADSDFLAKARAEQAGHMSDGSTFSFQYNRSQGNTYLKNGIFDTYGDSIFGIFVFLCALLGGYKAIKDKKTGVYSRLGWQLRTWLPMFNVLASAACGGLTVLLCETIIGGFDGFAWSCLYMAIYIVFAAGYVRLIAAIFSTESTYCMSVLLLSLGSLAAVLIQMGADSLVPWLSWIGRLFPPVWFAVQTWQNLGGMLLLAVLLFCPLFLKSFCGQTSTAQADKGRE